MDRFLKRPLVAVVLLIIICAYMFFFQLGKLALTDPDETFYAQTAREMTAKNEWVTPYLYGNPQFEKPILFYWLVEGSFKLFGVNEFAARLPSAAFGTAGVIAIFFLGSLFFNKRAGFLSALILATNIEYVILSRACITDMVLFVFLLLSILFFAYGYMRRKSSFYLLSAAAIALATLTKGPIYFLLFGLSILIFLTIRKDLKALKTIPWWRSALIFIAVAAPWYLAIYRAHGQAFIDGFFGFHNVNRFLVSEHKIGSQVYYNIPIMFGGMFPWSVFLPVGFWHFFKKMKARPGNEAAATGALMLLVWFCVIFAFFTASSTKLPTYIFPCFVSLAIIAAVALDDFARGEISVRLARGMRISYWILIIVMLFGWVGGAVYAKLDFPSITGGVIASSLFLVFGAVLSLICFWRRRYIMAFVFVAYAVALFLYPASRFLLPDVERFETSKEVAGYLRTHMKPEEALGCESNHLAGLAFYADKFPVDLDKHHIQIQFMNSPGRVWAVMKEKNNKHLYDPEITKVFVKPSYMVYKVGKRAVVTNEIPPDGKYMVKRGPSQ